jgi:hypothetical protein
MGSRIYTASPRGDGSAVMRKVEKMDWKNGTEEEAMLHMISRV